MTALMPRPTRLADERWMHVTPFAIAAIALFDGVAAWTGHRPAADWSLGIWSLPLGMLIVAAEVVDLRRPIARSSESA